MRHEGCRGDLRTRSTDDNGELKLRCPGAGRGKGGARRRIGQRKHDGTQISEKIMSTELERISELARQDRQLQFLSIAHYLTPDALMEAFKALRKDASAGVDGIRYGEYQKEAGRRIHELYERVRDKRYRAQPLRRVYIPKEDGKQRPLSIPSLADNGGKANQAEVTVCRHHSHGKECGLSNGHESLEQRQTARVGWTKEAQRAGTKNQDWSNICTKGKTSLAIDHQTGKRQQERIKKGAEQLAKFAKKVLERVPAALRKAKKHKNERVQRQIKKAQEQLCQDAELLKRVIEQSEARYAGTHLKNKVYSLHEPQVTCIAKGKRGKPNEYGSKVSISVDKNGFVIAHTEYDSNVGDNTTMEEAVSDWEAATGQLPENFAADRSYHMPEYPEKVNEVKRIAIPRTGRTKHPDADRKYFRRLQRKRASIEPVISHLKQDHRMDRCRYKGFDGDRINVSLAVTAWNARKWMRQMTKERNKLERGK